MTDRLKGCMVVFERDIREDDANDTLNAIRNIKGVLKVEPSLSTPEDWHAQLRARAELGRQILDLIYPPKASHEA